MHIYQEEEKMTRTASEDFKKNLEGGFRYVDKTELLIPLLNREHETTYWHYDTAEAFYHGVLLMLMQLNGDYFAKATGKVETGDFLLWPAGKSDRIWRLFSRSKSPLRWRKGFQMQRKRQHRLQRKSTL